MKLPAARQMVRLLGLVLFGFYLGGAPAESRHQTRIGAASRVPLRLGELTLRQGDRISIIGNTFAERMQHHGWLETRMHSRFPSHNLVFRNLGYSGDELTLRLRSAGFGSPDEWLARTKADVIFAFFGYNESYAGPSGLPAFRRDLDAFIRHTLSQNYNGRSPPQIVLFSPLAHENLHDPNLPDGSANNERLELYSKAMADVAAQHKIVFVDLFSLSREYYRTASRRATFNGIHLTEAGDKEISRLIDEALFGAAPERTPAYLDNLRQAVNHKNFFWYQRYRTVDGYSIYGGRADLVFVGGQTNRVVMQREMEILDVMTANRDPGVWAAASGKSFSEFKPDDNNLPPEIPVQTNKPGDGPNGTHLFLGAEEAIGLMTPHPGMQVNLFASEEQFPELANPVQMAFDVRGRLWVAVMPSYPHWKPGEKMDDKILILEDANGDGKADRCKTFAGGLHVPTGLEFWNNGLLVGQQPDLMFLRDTDGDDAADLRERVLHGIDSADTHHALNSFVLDPGGALYFQEGTFHHTQVETPWKRPERCANAGVFRYEPRTHKFDVYVSYGFANPHGHVFDRWGQDLVTDGTGNVNYFAAAFSGYVDFPNKHPGMEPIFKQRTRPCPGTEILSSRHFPDEFQGNYLVGNVIGFQGILQYRLEDKESGIEGTELEPIVSSRDPNFRPTDIEIGPDGAIYFSDWQNPIIGHMQHNLRDPSRDKTHGRVYRITAAGRPLLPPARIAGEPIPHLLDLLKQPEDRVRYRAKIELGGRPTADVLAALPDWMASLDPKDPEYEHHLLEALWVYQYHNVIREDLLKRMLRSTDFRARAAATRVLCYWRDRVPAVLDLLREQALDEHPRVRLEAVRACSFFRDAKAAEVALEVLRRSMDYYLNYTLRETMLQLEPYWKPAVSAGTPFAADNPDGVNYVLASVATADLTRLPPTPQVYIALLSRPGVPESSRLEALASLARLNKREELVELLRTLEFIDRKDSVDVAVMSDLAHIVTTRPRDELARQRGEFDKLIAAARQPMIRQVAVVAQILADGTTRQVWQTAAAQPSRLRDLLEAVPLIPDPALRAELFPQVKPLLSGIPDALRAALGTSKTAAGRYVRIDLPGRRRTLTLAEVEIFSGGQNVALKGKARQINTAHGGEAKRAIDGSTASEYARGSQTHTEENIADPWWEVDLGREYPIEEIAVWNRPEQGGVFLSRLDNFTLTVFDGNRQPVFVKRGNPAPQREARFKLDGDPALLLRRAALNAATWIPGHEAELFGILAAMIHKGDERHAAVQALARIPKARWPAAEVRPVIDDLIAYAASLAPEERAQPDVLDALQLGSDLASVLPLEQARALRTRIGDLGVQVIRLRSVPHLMIYDRRELAVQAGKPVQIVFENADIQPHNLVIARPGTLAAVGAAADRLTTDPEAPAKEFVPSIPEILFATRLIQSRETDRLTFVAPAEPGDYPFVCTYPGHWRRMYGTLHVVADLEEYLAKNPLPDPVGEVAARPFVKEWQISDLQPKLGRLNERRNLNNGKELFAAASCVTCHAMKEMGGQVGPDLAKWDAKMTPLDLLTEMVEPSKRIHEDYKAWVIVTDRGLQHIGRILSDDGKVVKLLPNPVGLEKCEPIEIPVDSIEEREPSKISMMPQGVLNTLTEDEIFDLLAYIIARGETGR